MLDLLIVEDKDFWEKIITGDETWHFAYDLQLQKSCLKMMLIILCDTHGSSCMTMCHCIVLQLLQCFWKKKSITVPHHPPYLPDLALEDYFLFLNSWNCIPGWHKNFVNAQTSERVYLTTKKDVCYTSMYYPYWTDFISSYMRSWEWFNGKTRI